MEIHIKIAGSLLIAMSMVQLVMPNYLKSQQEAVSLPRMTNWILYGHTFLIAVLELLMGLLCVYFSHELLHDSFGRVISLGLLVFSCMRLIFQLFVYRSGMWRTKKVGALLHVVFCVLSLYFSGVFLLCYLGTEARSLEGAARFNHGRGYYSTPYDSTQGIPNSVGVIVWIFIFLFLMRLAWEFRDEIFKKRE